VRRGRLQVRFPQPRYADLESSQRLETQQKPEPETGEQEPITGKTYDARPYSRPTAGTGLDMIWPECG